MIEVDLAREFLKAREEYLKVKEEYEIIRERARKATKPLDQLVLADRISVDEWAEKTVEIEFKLGLDDALKSLIDAKDRLIKAGRRYIETQITREEAEKIKEIWDCPLISIRDKIVDALLRLKV